MNGKMTRGDVLRACITVFDAIKRAASKGNAGLEARDGMEQSYQNDCQICEVLREMLREIEAGKQAEDVPRAGDKVQPVHDWQEQIMKSGVQERMMIF